MPAIYIKKVLSQLEEHGFYEIANRTNGDHHRFTDGKGHYVTVAFASKKGTIPPATYGKILRQMGLK